MIPRFNKLNNEKNINDSTISQTRRCNEYKFEKNAKLYNFIDTPGFNDTNGVSIDNKNFESVLEACQNFEYMNGILLILNGTDQRLTVTLRNLFENLKHFFPTKLIENVIIVLTNCSENSCNLDLNCLNGIVKHKSCHFMQNNFLHWDRKQKLKNHSIKFDRLEVDWNDSIETVDLILEDISNLSPIVTRNVFKRIEILTETVNTNVKEQLGMILEYLNKYAALKVERDVVNKSIENMEKNLLHEAYYEIDAIPHNGREKVRINVKLNNNLAIAQYKHSECELECARKNIFNIENQIQKSENVLNELIYNLSETVNKLKQECRGFNLTNHFHDLLSELNDVSNKMPIFKIYTQAIFGIFEGNYLNIRKERVPNNLSTSLVFSTPKKNWWSNWCSKCTIV